MPQHVIVLSMATFVTLDMMDQHARRVRRRSFFLQLLPNWRAATKWRGVPTSDITLHRESRTRDADAWESTSVARTVCV